MYSESRNLFHTLHKMAAPLPARVLNGFSPLPSGAVQQTLGLLYNALRLPVCFSHQAQKVD